MLDLSWSEGIERFLDEVSSEFEEPTVCELEFESVLLVALIFGVNS